MFYDICTEIELHRIQHSIVKRALRKIKFDFGLRHFFYLNMYTASAELSVCPEPNLPVMGDLMTANNISLILYKQVLHSNLHVIKINWVIKYVGLQYGIWECTRFISTSKTFFAFHTYCWDCKGKVNLMGPMCFHGCSLWDGRDSLFL